MVVHYFPDNNVLIEYVAQRSDKQEMLDSLIENTAIGGILSFPRFKGYITPSIMEEYGRTTSDSVVNGVAERIKKRAKKEKGNSLPIFISNVQEIEGELQKDIERTFLEYYMKKIQKLSRFDYVQLELTISEALEDCRIRRQAIIEKMFDCRKDNRFQIKLHETSQETDFLKSKLAEIFIIREHKRQSDETDNLHIILSAIYSLLIGKNTYFVTCDLFRCKKAATFEAAANKATAEIKSHLNADIRISKLDVFLSEHARMLGFQ